MSSLVSDGCSVKELFDSAESVLSKFRFGSRRALRFSGGSFDITANGYGLDEDVIRHSQDIQRDMIVIKRVFIIKSVKQEAV